jgi:hypothetical protein
MVEGDEDGLEKGRVGIVVVGVVSHEDLPSSGKSD